MYPKNPVDPSCEGSNPIRKEQKCRDFYSQILIQDIPWILLGVFGPQEFQDAAAVHAQLSGVQARSTSAMPPFCLILVSWVPTFFWGHVYCVAPPTMAYPTFVVDLKGLLDQLLFHGSSGQKIEEPIQVSLQIQHVKHVCPITFILFGKVLRV